MPLFNCEISLILTWPKSCVFFSKTGETEFAITDTKLYVLVVTLSTEDNIKLLKQLESGFKRTINWNKYQSKPTDQEQIRYFDYLIDPNFHGVNRLFVLSFENRTDKNAHTGYYIPKVETRDYSVVIDTRNFFDQPIKNDLKTYDNIRRMQLVKEMTTHLAVY